jgi:hypothetical protein
MIPKRTGTLQPESVVEVSAHGQSVDLAIKDSDNGQLSSL